MGGDREQGRRLCSVIYTRKWSTVEPKNFYQNYIHYCRDSDVNGSKVFFTVQVLNTKFVSRGISMTRDVFYLRQRRRGVKGMSEGRIRSLL